MKSKNPKGRCLYELLDAAFKAWDAGVIRAIPKMHDMGSPHNGNVNHLFIRFLGRFYERQNREEMLAREAAESASTAH